MPGDGAQAKPRWEFWHKFTETHCMHGKECSRKKQGGACLHGTRFQFVTLVTGAILPVWHQIENTVNRAASPLDQGSYGRVIRCTTTTDDHTDIIGMSVSDLVEDALMEAIQEQEEA